MNNERYRPSSRHSRVHVHLLSGLVALLALSSVGDAQALVDVRAVSVSEEQILELAPGDTGELSVTFENLGDESSNLVAYPVISGGEGYPNRLLGWSFTSLTPDVCGAPEFLEAGYADVRLPIVTLAAGERSTCRLSVHRTALALDDLRLEFSTRANDIWAGIAVRMVIGQPADIALSSRVLSTRVVGGDTVSLIEVSARNGGSLPLRNVSFDGCPYEGFRDFDIRAPAVNGCTPGGYGAICFSSAAAKGYGESSWTIPAVPARGTGSCQLELVRAGGVSSTFQAVGFMGPFMVDPEGSVIDLVETNNGTELRMGPLGGGGTQPEPVPALSFTGLVTLLAFIGATAFVGRLRPSRTRR